MQATMNRQQRRAQEHQQRQEEAQKAAQAARQYRQDIQQYGSYDVHTARDNPYYAAEVHRARQERQKRWSQNGITQQDVDKAREEGYNAGRLEVVRYYMENIYAAAGIAAHSQFGFGGVRIERLLREMHRVLSEEICTDDILQRLRDETGVDVKAVD